MSATSKNVCFSKTSGQLARNLARQLVTYATGAPVGFGGPRAGSMRFSTRPRTSQYGVRSIVQQLVAKATFSERNRL